MKGPVATLDAAASSVPPRLRVFETLPLQATWPKLDRGGVSINLLDYLLITALLLVTDAEEWVTLARPRAGSFSEGSSKPAPASVRQWRKIVYGEPLFPSLRSPKAAQVMEASSEDIDVMDISPSSLASRPASVRQWRKIVYGEPLFPSLSQYYSELEEFSRTSTPWENTSQSSESFDYPSTPGSSSAPAHGYLDPSFYNLDVPPISQYSLEYQSIPSLPESLSRPSLTRPQSSSSPSPVRASSTICTHSTTASTSTARPEPHLIRCHSTPFLNNLASSPPSQLPPATTAAAECRSTWIPGHRISSSFSPPSGRPLRLLPQPPQPVTTASLHPPSPHSAIVATSSARAQPPFAQRSLPATPARPLPPAMTSTEDLGHEQTMRRLREKAANEMVDWMIPVSRREQERQDHQSQSPPDAIFEAPPPPYNTIDFSHPPHASAPTTLMSASSSSLSAPPRATGAITKR